MYAYTFIFSCATIIELYGIWAIPKKADMMDAWYIQLAASMRSGGIVSWVFRNHNPIVSAYINMIKAKKKG